MKPRNAILGSPHTPRKKTQIKIYKSQFFCPSVRHVWRGRAPAVASAAPSVRRGAAEQGGARPGVDAHRAPRRGGQRPPAGRLSRGAAKIGRSGLPPGHCGARGRPPRPDVVAALSAGGPTAAQGGGAGRQEATHRPRLPQGRDAHAARPAGGLQQSAPGRAGRPHSCH